MQSFEFHLLLVAVRLSTGPVNRLRERRLGEINGGRPPRKPIWTTKLWLACSVQG